MALVLFFFLRATGMKRRNVTVLINLDHAGELILSLFLNSSATFLINKSAGTSNTVVILILQYFINNCPLNPL